MSEISTTHRQPRQIDGRLTERQLAELTTGERPYKVFDGNSLFVLVTPTGLTCPLPPYQLDVGSPGLKG